MSNPLVATLVLTAALSLPLALPFAVANDCGDVVIFSRNSNVPLGVNANGALCTTGGNGALPTLLNPGSDAVKVRYLTGNNDPGPLVTVLTVVLEGLGFDGETFVASRVSFATGPDAYDTDLLALPGGVAGSGSLTASVYWDVTLLDDVTYVTARQALCDKTTGEPCA